MNLFRAISSMLVLTQGSWVAFSQLPLGGVSNITNVTCPSGFYSGMTCKSATVSCPDTDSIQVTFGVKTPANHQGTIVLHAGAGGTQPFGNIAGQFYVDQYYKAKFRVVQLAWLTDWEKATATGPYSIKLAACRPATLIRYIYDTYHGGLSGTGGMCAHGQSGGSAAVAYALSWYEAGAYLDNAMLTSGPVFGDIEAGCKVPTVPAVTVCPTGQFGCNGAEWTANPQYTGSSQMGMMAWAGDFTCNNGIDTSAESDAAWKSMSIVDGTAEASFSYSHTSLSAYLCSNSAIASAQGQYFYSNFTNSGQSARYSVNRVDGCTSAENIWSGTVSGGGSAYTASIDSMKTDCVKRH